MSKKVLILGNGKSRLEKEHINFINSWDGEIWGCNRIYMEISTLPRLNRVIGDLICLKDMFKDKKDNNRKYQIYIKKSYARKFTNEDCNVLKIPDEFQKDSGTSFVALALEEKYDQIYVCGFDLGGKDIYVPNHEKKSKAVWVDRWRVLKDYYGLNNLHFVGKDHKPFIESNLSSDFYAKIYMKGEDHLKAKIPNPKKLKRKNTVLILGNGTSRLSFKDQISAWQGEIWVCNKGYTEYGQLQRIDRVGSVHQEVAHQAHIYKKRMVLNYHIFTKNVIGIEGKVLPFHDQRGWSTGSLMLLQAIYEKYDKIVLAGFDFGGPDIYQKKSLPGDNFKKQFDQILNENKYDHIFFLKEKGLVPVTYTTNLFKRRTTKTKPDKIPKEYSLKNTFKKGPELSELIKDKKIIVIGNGPVVEKLGKKIDKDYDYVIRLNDYSLSGKQSTIGSRTDYWFVNRELVCQNRDIEKIRTIFIPRKEDYKLEDAMLTDLRLKYFGENTGCFANRFLFEDYMDIYREDPDLMNSIEGIICGYLKYIKEIAFDYIGIEETPVFIEHFRKKE